MPHVLVFFAAILVKGLPMCRMHRKLWLVAMATAVLLLASMRIAMRKAAG